MYTYQSATGFEIDILTSRSKDQKLRDAIKHVTGDFHPWMSYSTRAEAQSVIDKINEKYKEL